MEAGAVFAEIAADPYLSAETKWRLAGLTGTPESLISPREGTRRTSLHDYVVWFSRNYRFRRDSGIGRLAILVNAGAADAVARSSHRSAGGMAG